MQWTNPLTWSSNSGGSPTSSDTVIFTHLPSTVESPVIFADTSPGATNPPTSVLHVGEILADGFYNYDAQGQGLNDWRIVLARFTPEEGSSSGYYSMPFALDVGNGNGLVRIGYFQEPAVFGGLATAIPGGLTITGHRVISNVDYHTSAGFRGVLDVRHGRLTLSDINFDDNFADSNIFGVVDSRDDLSYIPQRLPNAELLIDHSHFNAFQNGGLLIGSIGRATATIQNGSIVSNLSELRVGGNSLTGDMSHELSSLRVTDSHLTVGDGFGGVFVGDMAAPDLINPYNGTLTLTRSTLAPSVILDGQSQPIGVEPLAIHVGNFGAGKLVANDSSSITGRRLFVGERFFALGEMRMSSSNLTLAAPDGPETFDHAGRWSVGAQGLGFVVVDGTTAAPSTVAARSLTLGESQNAYGDVYLDRDTTMTLADSASVGIRGQGRLTVTGRFASVDPVEQRNLYAPSVATIGTRPSTPASDPSRNYTLTIGNVWASAGFVIVGEGGRIDVTDQPLTGTDQVDESGVELWRSTNHKLLVGDDGLGSLTVHADANVRAERVLIGQTSLGVGHVVLDKAMLNIGAANSSYAIPGTLRVSRGMSVGVHGVGTLDVRGPYVPRAHPEDPQYLDSFDNFGLLAASLTLGDDTGSSGTAKVYDNGQIRVNGTLDDERNLVIARLGAGYLDVSDPLVLAGSGPQIYVRGATGGTVAVVGGGTIRVGGTDADLFPMAKGTVMVYPNGLLSGGLLSVGRAVSSGDSFTTRAGATAQVNLPGGSEMRTFAGGTVRVDRVELDGDNVLAVESNPIAVTPGEARDGGFHVAQRIDVNGGTLRLGMFDRSSTGTVMGNVSIHGGQLVGGGTITGDLQFAGGTLSVQLRGVTRFTGYDAFDVGANASFTSGGIVVSAGDFVGQIGQQFDVVHFTAGTRSAAFRVMNPLASQPGTQWVSYLDADSFTLAVAGASGDTNFDGAVNFDDLLILAQHYNSPDDQSWITGDFNGDLLTNFDDLLILAQNYGMSLLGESNDLHSSFAADWAMAQLLAPEPASLGMLIALPLLRTRRRETATSC